MTSTARWNLGRQRSGLGLPSHFIDGQTEVREEKRLPPDTWQSQDKSPCWLTPSARFSAEPRDGLQVLLNTAVQPATLHQPEVAHGSECLSHEHINALSLPAGVTF